ncbi:hypothetical protein LTR66_006485 [Elasticomyces elasticus]|nr:hypothetical protein LTR66_006485 [Elasticomyces elasticus]
MFSSRIDKSTRKFQPKAVARRRPAADPSSASSTPAATPAPAAESVQQSPAREDTPNGSSAVRVTPTPPTPVTQVAIDETAHPSLRARELENLSRQANASRNQDGSLQQEPKESIISAPSPLNEGPSVAHDVALHSYAQPEVSQPVVVPAESEHVSSHASTPPSSRSDIASHIQPVEPEIEQIRPILLSPPQAESIAEAPASTLESTPPHTSSTALPDAAEHTPPRTSSPSLLHVAEQAHPELWLPVTDGEESTVEEITIDPETESQLQSDAQHEEAARGRSKVQPVGAKRKRGASLTNTEDTFNEVVAGGTSESAGAPATKKKRKIANGGATLGCTEKAAATRRQKNATRKTVAEAVQDGGTEEVSVARKGVRKPRKVLSQAVVVDSDDEGDDTARAGDSETQVEAEDMLGTSSRQPKPRSKGKRKTANNPATTQDGDVAADATGPGAQKVLKTRKPRQRKRTAAAMDEQDTDLPADGEIAAETAAPVPKRRKKPLLPTDDPEIFEIDPTSTTMTELTRDDKRVGKASALELKMQEVDWKKVREDERAEVERSIAAAENGESIDQPNATSANRPASGEDGTDEDAEDEEDEEDDPTRGAGTVPRLRIVNGQIVIDESSLIINREKAARRAMVGQIPVEGEDITKRINSHTWLNNNKRDIRDRVPTWMAKADRWDDEETDRFYDALRMFGTDFAMISRMFPGRNRRQIKCKYLREERLDPERLHAAIHDAESVPINLDHYVEKTGKDMSFYKDPIEITEELAAQEEANRPALEEARRKAARERANREEYEKQHALIEQERIAKSERLKAARANRNRREAMGTGTFG